MALRNQPYIPLYVQDYLTDEKLAMCSAEATGVYSRLMCLMHKSDEYGTILLKQKDKQTKEQIKNFALKLVKMMPYDEAVIYRSLKELLDEKVVYIKGDKLCQKRMISDNLLSIKRSEAGKIGGKRTQDALTSAKASAKAKHQANSENENEVEYESETDNKLSVSNYSCERKGCNNQATKTLGLYRVCSDKCYQDILEEYREDK